MSHTRIRVLHLLTALGPGGAEVWLLNLIRPLADLGVDIAFALKAPELGSLDHVARERGARTYEVRLPLTHVRYIRTLSQIIHEERFDILHTHEFVYSGAGVLAAALAGVPAVMTLHHYTFDAQTPLTRRFGVRQLREVYGRASLSYALRKADAVTAFSHAVMNRVVPTRLQDSRCSLLRLCVTPHDRASNAARSELRRSFGWEDSTPLVIHAGRFVEQKNHFGLLRVFRTVLRSRPDARLVLLGQGPLEVQIRDAARDLVDSGCVRFLGVRTDVPNLLALADLLLFPSRDEGFGLVALEANACGLPVVGTRVPGLAEAVVDGETAQLHNVEDEVGMARSVVALLGDPDRTRTMGSLGAQRARSLFTPEASASLLTDVYRRLV